MVCEVLQRLPLTWHAIHCNGCWQLKVRCSANLLVPVVAAELRDQLAAARAELNEKQVQLAAAQAELAAIRQQLTAMHDPPHGG
jgi:hypothetical protein